MKRQLPENGGPGRYPTASGPRDPRGIRTRQALADAGEPLSVRQVAAAAGLSTGEASRMLDNLASNGRARKVQAGGHGRASLWTGA